MITYFFIAPKTGKGSVSVCKKQPSDPAWIGLKVVKCTLNCLGRDAKDRVSTPIVYSLTTSVLAKRLPLLVSACTTYTPG
jgi:hypothetical protein